MITTKDEYLNVLSTFVKEELFLTDQVDLINEEISQNCLAISISLELVRVIEMDDFLSLLSKIKANRLQQLQDSPLNIDLIYYLWFDEMAGQLRLNFINSNHKNLPFHSKFVLVDREEKIIHEFLNSQYLDGIPFNQLINTKDIEPVELDYSTKVYTQTLKRQ